MTAAEIDLSLAIGDRGLRSFLTAIAITQIVEVPIYMAALRRRPPSGSGRARARVLARDGESKEAKESARDGESASARDGESASARDGESTRDGETARDDENEEAKENARDGENTRDGETTRDAETTRDGESEEAKESAPGAAAARAGIAFGASLLTHPIVWFVMPGLAMGLYTACALPLLGGRGLGVMGRTLLYGALAEGFAVAAEALYLRAFGVRRALVWSVGANAASVVVGTLVVWGLDL